MLEARDDLGRRFAQEALLLEEDDLSPPSIIWDLERRGVRTRPDDDEIGFRRLLERPEEISASFWNDD